MTLQGGTFGSVLEHDLIEMATEAYDNFANDKDAIYDYLENLELGSKEHPFLGTCYFYLMYDLDGGQWYVAVGFTFYSGRVFAEIEDGTFGELQWFRVYM